MDHGWAEYKIAAEKGNIRLDRKLSSTIINVKAQLYGVTFFK